MALKPVITIAGTAVPVPGPDMDTDRIIPSRFLKCITFDELAGTMFWDERFNADGSSKGHPIDDPRFKGASIILGGENFGCGSSREHAPQAIKRSGIQAVIAETFAEIFFGNSTGIGLPCVRASREDINRVTAWTEQAPATVWTLDLNNMQLSSELGSIPVSMPEEPREALTQGRWDAVVELMGAPEAVEALAAKLPVPTAH
ncbi:3-isopropylmalate dehydratase small subunit [Akkermansia glycaniphila]|uniref:3-isopropylmalate dehydratase small subunit n=1 Tax=Akkermansia glycaniphila TaxID=1679444 RepID=UPI001C01E884|nr:3-isopropylmalate dehydratase small subunit [Akkermansia glycaniphila]MBT9450443.1 3-isopropylmalate dehydratase small subunit [Akkermansia glycaniphila]